MCLTRLDFYPRSPCGERPNNLHISEKWARISIHALLAESDWMPWTLSSRPARFLSTLSLRRATPQRPHTLYGRIYFYPRSPCGERLSKNAAIGKPTLISIHALLAESDLYVNMPCAFDIISIHALLAESDAFRSPRIALMVDFYPRSPCGERRICACMCTILRIFLSTLSLRRATLLMWYQCNAVIISIHALLAESDHYFRGAAV